MTSRRVSAHEAAASLGVIAAAERPDIPPRMREALVDAQAVADYLAVDRDWVYTHAAELGARRLGAGPRARLRFSLAEVDALLSTCLADRGSSLAESGRDPASLSASQLPRRN